MKKTIRLIGSLCSRKDQTRTLRMTTTIRSILHSVARPKSRKHHIQDKAPANEACKASHLLRVVDRTLIWPLMLARMPT